jgi:hypothetical protein
MFLWAHLNVFVSKKFEVDVFYGFLPTRREKVNKFNCYLKSHVWATADFQATNGCLKDGDAFPLGKITTFYLPPTYQYPFVIGVSNILHRSQRLQRAGL